jgi:SAM-dependent methyltransferase
MTDEFTKRRSEEYAMLKPRKLQVLGICLVLAIGGVWVGGYAQTRTPDVQYVPTPHNVVAEMLRLTGVTKDDVVYDLGCGDGRLVITAAERFGARGVGIDIDPQRIRESRANARKAGVTDRVQFRQQDLFEADIRDATVVTLYLLPKLNVALRPKLLRELQPGTRVVSHAFDMAEWRPDQTVRVKGPTREHSVYFWVIPANVEGEWRVNVPAPTGARQYLLRLQQQYQDVRGTMRVDGQDIPLTHATLTGDHLHSTVITGEQVTMSFDGRVKGQAMRGSMEAQGGAMAGRHDWASRREAASAGSAAQR